MIDMDVVVAGEKERFEDAAAGEAHWCASVVFFRDDDVYFLLMCADGNRDPLLDAARLMIRVAEPDAVMVVFDSYHVTSPTKLDGTEWEPGSMQHEVETGGPSAHLVGEALNLVRVDVTGSTSCCLLQYKRDGKKIVWGNEERHTEDDGDFMAQGVIVDELRRAFREEPLMRSMLREVGGEEGMRERFGYSIEEARVGMLAVALKDWLPTGSYAAALGVASEAEAAVLTSILPPGFQMNGFGDES